MTEQKKREDMTLEELREELQNGPNRLDLMEARLDQLEKWAFGRNMREETLQKLE